MEAIDSEADGPNFQGLQLCPHCYIVTWSDADGLHLRQGVPMKDGVPVSGNTTSDRPPLWMAGEPKEC
jgi:hypothetical protein